jgi:hypothetical protein
MTWWPVKQSTCFSDAARPSRSPSSRTKPCRFFNVRVGAALSSPRYLTEGIRQGFLLSPLLFALYTSDISLPVHPHTRVAIYGDARINYSRQSHLFYYVNFISTPLLDGVDSGTYLFYASKSKALFITKKRHVPYIWPILTPLAFKCDKINCCALKEAPGLTAMIQTLLTTIYK